MNEVGRTSNDAANQETTTFRHVETTEYRTTQGTQQAQTRSRNNTPDRLASQRIDALTAGARNAYHSEQVIHNEGDNSLLLDRMTRNNRDIENVVKEVYEKHGI